MAENVPSINLLPNKNESFINQFLTWTLSIGRLLIIIVEMLALGTFLYRFSLDMQIIDLHDKVEAQSFILANFNNSESNFRDLQDRLATVKRYDTLGSRTTTIFREITDLGRGQITFRTLSVETGIVTIEAQAPSATNLSQFVDKLRSYPSITSVSIDKVENNTAAANVTVSLTATLKEAPFDTTESSTQSQTTTKQLNSAAL